MYLSLIAREEPCTPLFEEPRRGSRGTVRQDPFPRKVDITHTLPLAVPENGSSDDTDKKGLIDLLQRYRVAGNPSEQQLNIGIVRLYRMQQLHARVQLHPRRAWT